MHLVARRAGREQSDEENRTQRLTVIPEIRVQCMVNPEDPYLLQCAHISTAGDVPGDDTLAFSIFPTETPFLMIFLGSFMR